MIIMNMDFTFIMIDYTTQEGYLILNCIQLIFDLLAKKQEQMQPGLKVSMSGIHN